MLNYFFECIILLVKIRKRIGRKVNRLKGINMREYFVVIKIISMKFIWKNESLLIKYMKVSEYRIVCILFVKIYYMWEIKEKSF